jgi:Holliday junction resolvasome RuvABC endonuclease subunit
MSFVGADTALGIVGLFAYEPDQWYLSHRIQSKKLRGPARLTYLRDGVVAWLDSLPSITCASIEDGAFGSEGRLFQLGGIQHIVQLELWSRVQISLTEVAPVQLKKFQTGQPGALKEWMLKAANDFVQRGSWPHTEIRDDNIADALGLARVAHALYTGDVRTRAEAEVVVSLQNSKRIYEVP